MREKKKKKKRGENVETETQRSKRQSKHTLCLSQLRGYCTFAPSPKPSKTEKEVYEETP